MVLLPLAPQLTAEVLFCVRTPDTPEAPSDGMAKLVPQEGNATEFSQAWLSGGGQAPDLDRMSEARGVK